MTSAARWHLVLPVKGGPEAKTRLVGAGADRRDLALAMALDCLDAALGARCVDAVQVVTADAEVAAAVRAAGAGVVAPGPVPAGRRPLDAAVADGLAATRPAATHAAGTAPRVAVLLADLPALRSAELAAALDLAADALRHHPGGVLVPDADGRGTVLLAPGPAGPARTAFGPGSASRHEALGVHRLELRPDDAAGLRRDVDTPGDLAEAELLGLGPRTADLLERARRDGAPSGGTPASGPVDGPADGPADEVEREEQPHLRR